MTTNDQPRFRYVNESVGLMVLLAVVLFVAAMLGSGQVREWLNPGERLKVILPPEGLYGLSEGAVVEILGTEGGKVMKIIIDPSRQMHAEVQIREEMTDFVRRDSRVSIHKRFGVAGATYLDITRGSGEPIDWDYAVLEAEIGQKTTLDDLIADLQTRVLPVIDEAHAAVQAFSAMTRDLQNPEGDFKQILSSLNEITGGIARGEGTIGRVLRRDEMADQIETLLAQLDQSLRRLPPILAKLDRTAEGLPEISGKAQEVMNSLDAILGDLKQGSLDLPILLLQARQTLVELEKLLQNMQTSWLFGGSEKESEPSPGRVSPLEVRP